MKKILKNWHLILIGAFILFAGLIFLISGENSIISAIRELGEEIGASVINIEKVQNTAYT